MRLAIHLNLSAFAGLEPSRGATGIVLPYHGYGSIDHATVSALGSGASPGEQNEFRPSFQIGIKDSRTASSMLSVNHDKAYGRPQASSHFLPQRLCCGGCELRVRNARFASLSPGKFRPEVIIGEGITCQGALSFT